MSVNVLRGLNPLTRLLLMVIITTPLLATVDWVSAAVALGLTVAVAPLCGMPWPRLARVAWPLLVVAPVSGVSMLLYGRPGGEVYFEWWLIRVTENSVTLAAAIMVRVLAMALPVVVLARDIDPTELGDALAQVGRLPARFVIGAMAGLRMVGLFKDDWQSLERARRARGIADTGRLKHVATMSFGLLVLALRRGGKLATAMEARGFGRTPPGVRRTWARESRLHARDGWALVVGAGLTALPVLAALWAGTWRWFGL